MPVPTRLLTGALFALLVLSAVGPALAAPEKKLPVSMPPADAEGERITLSMLLMGEALPEGGPNVAFVLRTPRNGADLPLGHGIHAGAASCSSISPAQGGCSTTFSNAPGTTRTVFIYPTGFVGTISVTVLEESSPRAATTYACRSPVLSTSPVGNACTGSPTFKSDASSLGLAVTASGVGYVMVEVR